MLRYTGRSACPPLTPFCLRAFEVPPPLGHFFPHHDLLKFGSALAMVLNPFPLPADEPGAGFACWSESIELVTTTAPEFIDLTEQVEGIVARSPVAEGLAVVVSRPPTAAITLNGLEPLLLEDMAEFLGRLAPQSHAYRHN